MKLRFALALGVMLGCGGTGDPSDGDRDCGTTALDLDAGSALGFRPVVLWDTYVGRYEGVGEWRDASGLRDGDDRVRVTIEVSRDQHRDALPHECTDHIPDNHVRAPVVVRIDAGDASVSGTEHVWLEGDLASGRITLGGDMAVGGWIDLADGRAVFKLSPADGEPRDLWSTAIHLEP